MKWPQTLDPQLDAIARYNRQYAHFRVRNIDDARHVLAYGPHAFMLSVPITDEWYSSRDGVISYPTRFSPKPEHHAFCVLGYDDKTEMLEFINSWGPNWGNGGFGSLPYSYFTDFQDEAWLAMPYNKIPKRETDFTHVLREEVFSNPLGNPGLIIDLWDIDHQSRFAWAISTFRDDALELEDFYIAPEQVNEENVRRLAEKIFEWKDHGNYKFRYWIPHCDRVKSNENYKAVQMLVKTYNMKIYQTYNRWAARLATL